MSIEFLIEATKHADANGVSLRLREEGVEARAQSPDGRQIGYIVGWDTIRAAHINVLKHTIDQALALMADEAAR